ncbi:hypothetical protein KFL_000990020 [Klebsormidium nitens]|uniref:AB hydrolase-1 domain-containing protein n=1 Tax=Klebsormidium nitens TaxID=105231 RepID=A0A1Y1HV66_KLENI|nr:hypothetical protein KFL_000990020 [Klebsormidium nitens]|eukprot:GAQ82053.1 hypothetical protein KFL_000990020 [Klebsormidium nitens]
MAAAARWQRAGLAEYSFQCIRSGNIFTKGRCIGPAVTPCRKCGCELDRSARHQSQRQGQRAHTQKSFQSTFIGRNIGLWHRNTRSTGKRAFSVHATLTRPVEHTSLVAEDPPGLLAYELVQGALVRWSDNNGKRTPAPPTAVLLHGILGGRRNWSSFARRLAQEFPNWQFLLVDLRCHGESAAVRRPGPHSVDTAALDVLQLIVQLKLVPRMLIGHSFGGKVALSMVEQAKKPLAQPVQVWVLDATPGLVRAGLDEEDHPAELIAALKKMPKLVPDRRYIIDRLIQEGFSPGIAQWMTTNLKKTENGYGWVFNLAGISDMYRSYEDTYLWRIVEDVPAGIHINFLRAERSLHRWHRDDIDRIYFAEHAANWQGGAGGVQMHVLADAGHWVHTDNPEGLFRILAPSFGPTQSRQHVLQD